MDFIKENRAALAVVAVIAGLLVSGVVINQNEMQNEQQNNEAAQNEADKKDADKSDKAKTDESNENANKENDADTTTPTETEMTQTDDTVSFMVAAGESYTTLARQAVQAHDGELSKAQVIAAETYLTQGAGEPAVNEGQTVEMQQSDIEAAVKKAKNLSEADIAAWEAYVPHVQF